MHSIGRLWIAGLALAAGTIGLQSASAAGSTAAPRASAASSSPPTVTAGLMTRRSGTLAPGTALRASALGERVFPDAKHGFALAAAGQAQYPASSTDGGKTWRTDGPALHIDAAQAPLSVVDLGATNDRTIFAYGSGQVIDTTSDGGKHWYQALFTDGTPMAVVGGISGHLVAYVDGFTSATSSTGVTWQYVSRDGGRSWHYDGTPGGS